MKYMAIIDADEKPVSCKFIGCNGNVAPYLIGETTNIKAIEREPSFNKIIAEIEQIEINGYIRDIECFRAGINTALNVINKYKVESEEK